MSKLTREVLMERYGATAVRFTSYYKFSFQFEGIASDGVRLVACTGGSADDIYRDAVNTNDVPLSELEPRLVLVYRDEEIVAQYQAF